MGIVELVDSSAPLFEQARPVLELLGVGKVYPGPLEVLREIDLVIRSGELVAVVGPSGSGKSTLLHLMGTLDRPSSGTIRVDGVDIAELDDNELSALRAHRIGFVFQQFFLLDGMTALDNVANGLLYAGIPLSIRRTRAEETLRRVGMGARLEHVPSMLSGGERQRVAIARALIARPAIVFADEPTGNLDSQSGAEVLTLLHELNAEGATIVVITHEHEVANQMRRQIVIRDGRIQSDASTTPASPVEDS